MICFLREGAQALMFCVVTSFSPFTHAYLSRFYDHQRSLI
jgi:hypothetical protein